MPLSAPYSTLRAETNISPVDASRFLFLKKGRDFSSDAAVDDTSTLEGTSNTQDNNNNSNRQSKKKKKKRFQKRQHSRSNKANSNAKKTEWLQLQDVHTKDVVESLFEKLAATTELPKLRFATLLKERLQKSSNQNKSVWGQVQKYLKRNTIPSHVKDEFWDLIVAKTAAETPENTEAAAEKDPSSLNEEEDILVFSKARDWSVKYPFFWSNTRKRNIEKNLKNEQNREVGKALLEEYLQQRSRQLEHCHYNCKSADERMLETQTLVRSLQKMLPSKYYQRLINLFAEHNDACQKEMNQEKIVFPKKRKIRMLFSNLKNETRTHVHLVAPSLTDYFYVNYQFDVDDVDADPIVADMPSSDIRVKRSEKEWESAKNEFVTSFMTIHSMLLEEDKLKQEDEKDDGDESDRGSDSDDTSLIQEEEIYGGKDDEESDFSEESVMKTFQDAAPIKSSEKATNFKLDRPRHYIQFEAISIGDWFQSPPSPDTLTPLEGFPLDTPADRVVFIDNLPIDVNENRLLEAYSRCGKVDAVQIFHRRPELDPGRRADDSIKKIRRPSNYGKKWQRPRTPLYAIVKFQDENGAKQATIDHLRIFGMVLDKHLIRSYRASDMTKLYLEDIAAGNGVTAIEYELTQVLHPKLYVCLDIGDRQSSRSGARSCVIKFSNFETAYWSYLKLKQELDFLKKEDQECTLHWMNTPRDAHLYWTRQLNF